MSLQLGSDPSQEVPRRKRGRISAILLTVDSRRLRSGMGALIAAAQTRRAPRQIERDSGPSEPRRPRRAPAGQRRLPGWPARGIRRDQWPPRLSRPEGAPLERLHLRASRTPARRTQRSSAFLFALSSGVRPRRPRRARENPTWPDHRASVAGGDGCPENITSRGLVLVAVGHRGPAALAATAGRGEEPS